MSRVPRLLTIAVVLVILAIVARWTILPAAGEYLVKADEPFKAEAAVVLAGDPWGFRIVRGAELKREGLVDKVLASGGPGIYGLYESDLAVRYAVSKGFPEAWFEALHEEAHSTQEEAHLIVLELKRRGIKRVMVVTSDYHTRRAGRIFRHTAPWLDLRMIAAPDRYFDRHQWWRDRESGKHVFTEWAKLIAFSIDFFPPEHSGPVLP